MKFGKQIQRRQLDLPEYAASFFNYKALKKLIKQLSATPTIPAQGTVLDQTGDVLDAQAALRANKEVFFFRLEREIEKVNVFYLQKEAEFSLRLKTLLDKQRVIQSRRTVSNSKAPANFVALIEGFQQFDGDLNKLQWDKTSKSRTKELYLQRAVEVQPCFNREVLRDLSDRATTARLELEAWAEGENIQFNAPRSTDRPASIAEEDDSDLHILNSAAVTGNLQPLRDWLSKIQLSPDAADHLTRIFLTAVNEYPDEVLTLLLETNLVDVHAEDDINERNCLHEAVISGRQFVFDAALERGVDISHSDVYGRIPLHYACMHGRVGMVHALLEKGLATIDLTDHDNFTPLIHSIIKDQVSCVEQLLSHNARINPASESDHIPLNLACQHASLAVIKILLERDAKFLPDAEGLYPQHLVARSCRSSSVLLLLKGHGADLDQRDKLYQWTPLFHAAAEGCVGCLRTLLDCGVDADALDEKGLPAMYYAVWEGHLECMNLLWSQRTSRPIHGHTPLDVLNGPRYRDAMTATLTPKSDEKKDIPALEVDGIPDLSLPPPIIPLRHYGHNFLDNKTFVQIHFNPPSADPIVFYQTGRYAAARLTISSKMTDLIPRNVMLPLQEDSRFISFHIDKLENFAIDFEIFPTFGSKVIAKTVALPDVFENNGRSSGHCCLPVFDPRLRAIGEIRFNFQVIKPYYGDPLEITHFATYWKATSAFDAEHNGQVTGSSLSGDYVQIFVQMTRDLVPVLYPEFTIMHHGVRIPISHLSIDEFRAIGLQHPPTNPYPSNSNSSSNSTSSLLPSLAAMSITDIPTAHRLLATSFLTLEEVLLHLPTSIHVNLCILYPSPAEQKELDLRLTFNINNFADAVLTRVFNHARASRLATPDFMRSVVFTSYNVGICVALNWKQPNYPVLLCNDLGQARDSGSGSRSASSSPPSSSPAIQYSGRASLSIKESARIAQSNNLMGLMCRSSLLNVMPSLAESIKELGLVLVADTSDDSAERRQQQQNAGSNSTSRTGFAGANDTLFRMPGNVNGVMRETGVLRFNDSIDM
ncbi:ankyrin repeat protein nuc-2 [Arthroderma uncinatum]|uniref:ankyrin repeat protein nuc-2 n=1 Tax=Arthroderma uncinatum TaxID=74035 RepID=UPI00144A5B27|nr:ankyrin repeat protein nuc-2 [Arthroderma uncinatum]KAF3492016.1 ankyrin repeat protein nuc-2 [Arthroderma uncinatum]